MPARARKLEQDEVVVSENEDGIDITANVDNPTPDPSNYGPKLSESGSNSRSNSDFS
jgi:hypothetical protein